MHTHTHIHTHTISLLYLIELGQFSLSLSLQTLNNQLPSQGAPADERPSDYSGSWRGPLSWSKLTGASQSVRQRLVDGFLHLYWTMTSWLLCTSTATWASCLAFACLDWKIYHCYTFRLVYHLNLTFNL